MIDSILKVESKEAFVELTNTILVGCKCMDERVPLEEIDEGVEYPLYLFVTDNIIQVESVNLEKPLPHIGLDNYCLNEDLVSYLKGEVPKVIEECPPEEKDGEAEKALMALQKMLEEEPVIKKQTVGKDDWWYQGDNSIHGCLMAMMIVREFKKMQELLGRTFSDLID